MNHKRSLLFFTLILTISFIKSFGQIIVVSPYLQDATPTSINIMWETSQGGNNIVYWDTLKTLQNNTQRIFSTVNHDSSQIHRAQLTELSPSTTYYYKVKTGDVESNVYHFTTPPLPEEEKSFQIVAMSDMQRDNAHPDKFKEIVEEGVFSYLKEDNEEKDIFENLGMVIIAGDLVSDGLSYTDWTNDFFRQSKNLFPYVPVYPVLGNHENNSDYYFNYFHLPENGTPGYLEHWWYKDYGNVRIIGLNSNKSYRIQEQLDWLDEVLKESETDDNIDFVFAQLHHPHKSELWIEGELDYTGEVIYRLEQFSTRTGKPTIHFFGHTHAYSRGQSLNHTHLWVNVATAGGNIDYWNEYPQNNYDEFSVSNSEYGFVLLEVEAGDDPKFKLIRISRGDEVKTKDNEINDIIEISRYNIKPEIPIGLSPIDNIKVNSQEVILKANSFNISDNKSEHGETQWQVARIDNFTNPDIDIRKNYEDWYNTINLNEGIDLTQQSITGLKDNTEYYWRVRYRTKGLEWSNWSAIYQFKTK